MSTIHKPYIRKQIIKFDELWQETRSSWPPQGFSVDKHIKKTLGLILVPPKEAWENICDITDVISGSWPWNVSYTLPQLHITLAGLGSSQNWKESEDILEAILQYLSSNQDPIDLDFRGLNLLRNTIVVQVIDKQDKLRALVEAFSKQVTEAGLSKNLKIGIHDQLWWTSIVRLYQPIPDEILAFVDSFRDTFLGSTTIQSLNLVENNKTHDPLEVTILGSYKFLEKI